MTTQRENDQDAVQQEQEKLDSVIRTIHETTAGINSRMPVSAGTVQAADLIQQMLKGRASDLQGALQQPYFGRVDYLQQDPQAPNGKTIYIGTNHIDDEGIVSWAAPIASIWYTNDSEYTAPSGTIRVRVDLKRFLRIRNQQVIEVNDLYTRALPPGTAAPANPALTAALSEVGPDDDQLSVIIETIQPDQYSTIANVSERILVVQGAAGSGKSEVGLHRIAYLLSPFNSLAANERPAANTTLFVGPSRSFLEYVGDVLPQLGVSGNVTQTTLREWMTELQSVAVKSKSRIWNNLQNIGQLTRFNEKAETFKGSMDMANTLDRHVRNLVERTRQALRDLPPLVVDLPEQNRFTLSSREVLSLCNEALSDARENPMLNTRRRELADRLARRIASVSSSRPGEETRHQRRVETAIVNPWLDRWWPHIDFMREYAALLADSDNLVRCSKEAISVEDARSLTETVTQPATANFEDSDLGALTYLDHLLNNTIRRRYRHIVVDEAQDISPIEFRLLNLSSVNNWFTILGDTAQRLTPYRGIRYWWEIKRPLNMGLQSMKVQSARTSYRATKTITRFNNRILRLFDKYISAPTPYDREGHRVEFHRHGSTGEMYQNVVNDLERIRSLDNLADATIAILVRDRKNLERFRKFCIANEIDEVTQFGVEKQSTGTVLVRIPEAKGLEFDAVIVLGVNESFASTTFNQKLLYMATTRAKHYLAIHWSGQHSPIIKAVSDVGILKHDHRKAPGDRLRRRG